MSERRKLIADPELQAMGEVVAVLESLAPQQRDRVLRWLDLRYPPVPSPMSQRHTSPLFPEAEAKGYPPGHDPQLGMDAEEGV